MTAGPVRSALKQITIDQQRPFAESHCVECRTVQPWTRERARQHANDKRHTVRYVIEQHTVYAPTGDTQ